MSVGAPQDFPQVPPRDLYPISDIRFVMTEIGKLTANVERLIVDVKSHSEKLQTIRDQSTYIKGWIAAAVLLVGAFITIASFFLSGKADGIIKSVSTLTKVS